MPAYWMRGIGAAKLASALTADPQMCGLAQYEVPFALMPGRQRLAGRAPLFALDSTDPLAAGHLPEVASNASRAFNRIVAKRALAKQLPAQYSARQCDEVGGDEVCIFARDGGCTADSASSFAINDALARIDR